EHSHHNALTQQRDDPCNGLISVSLGIGLPIHPTIIFKHDFFVILILLKINRPTSPATSPEHTQYRITHTTIAKHIFQQFNNSYI
ncbi:hypothetical protein M0F12_23915, partial [Ralstonia solanacearum]